MYELPSLDYDYEALEPHLSGDMMRLHHDFHHKAYVDKLNAALESLPELSEKPLVELLAKLDEVPENAREAIRNYGGGYYNHAVFWKWLTPNSTEQPTGELQADLLAEFGSWQNFVDQFSAAATGLFGSGWVWLLPDLTIMTTQNQDVPMSSGLAEPILGLDVWEHAYYLDYTYKRADYIKAWRKVVNWDEVARLYSRETFALDIE